MDSRHSPLLSVAREVENDGRHLAPLKIASSEFSKGEKYNLVIPDLVSERSETESVGNPCLNGCEG
jgi:lipopolysaccharide biosynthesis protein